MKNLCVFALLIVMFTACNKANKAIKERIVNSDSVAINYFKADGKMDTVIAVKIISDKATLDQLTELISASSSSATTTCGFSGSLHFFKKDRVVQDIDFAMSDSSCNQFSFKMMMGGEWNITALSPEAKQLLEVLKK